MFGKKKTVDEQSKKDALEAASSTPEGHQTTDQGIPVSDNQNSLTSGIRGPTLIEDFVLREKLTHFDHERIPERVVHARGSAAHGYFQPYESLAEYTRAKFLQDPSQKTPVFVRFSTVVGSRGSADTVRDVRGFATKFYTEEGNFDLVGNNMPVFFIQDAMKFPDLVHAIKPEPDHEMPQASAAHDSFWDFISLTPESMHMTLWVLSDRALPRSYRMMEGFGVHTFRLVNADGKSRFVKFHWKPVLGVHSLVWDEVQKIAGKDPDFNRRDLWEAIAMGDYPEYELGLQIVEEDQASSFEFDLLDPTKLIPEELVPVRLVGKMVLNRNPDEFFTETEQVAFHPGNVVPGIDFTNDPLLQGRLFSYLDTQLTRLGGPNFAEIPINRPLVAVHNHHRDGFMRQTIQRGRVNYEPNSIGGGCPHAKAATEGGFRSIAERLEGLKVRERSESFADHFTQATLFWRSQSKVEQQHLVEALHFELGKVETKHIRERMVSLLANVDSDLAERTASGIGVTNVSADLSYLESSSSPKPNARRGAAAPGRSRPLSIEDSPKKSARTRRVAVLAADGVSASDIETVVKALKSEGAVAQVISKALGKLHSADGQEVTVDKSFSTTASVLFDAVYVPGGIGSVERLAANGDAIHFLNEAFRHCKPIAASGEGIALLGRTHITGVALSQTGVCSDKGVVTAREQSHLKELGAGFIAAIAQHRHWERQKESVPA